MLFWEEATASEARPVADDVVDLGFALQGREIPVDHAYSLSRSLQQALPWLRDDDRVGVHLIHVASSQNGWERPHSGSTQLLQLSRRTKLYLRVPAERVADAQQLTGSVLDIAGHRLKVGGSKTRLLSTLNTLFSRHVVIGETDDEAAFLRHVAEELDAMGIQLKKALCGIPNQLATPQRTVSTRSLLVADLSSEDSLRLQRQGLGPHRKMGCGIFIAHKGIEAVKKQPGD